MHKQDGFNSFILRLIFFLSFAYIILPYILSLLPSSLEISRFPKIEFYHSDIFLLSFALLFMFINRDEIKEDGAKQKFNESIIFFLLSIISFVFYIFLGKLINFLFFKFHFANQPLNFTIVYLAYFLILLSLFLAIFNLHFAKKYKKTLAILFISFLIFYAISYILFQNSQLFTISTSKIVYLSLSFMHKNASIIIRNEPVLIIDKFSATIGPACSGIDSIIMFAMLYCIFLAYIWRTIDKIKGILLLSLGIIGAYYINAIRIYLLMIAGTINPEFAKNSFHNNIGWILFFIYYGIFIYISHKILTNTKK